MARRVEWELGPFFRFELFSPLVFHAFGIFAVKCFLDNVLWWWLDNLHINPTNLLSWAKFFHSKPLRAMKAFSEKFIFTKKLPLYPCLSSLKTKFSVKFITAAQSCPPSLAFLTETFETEKFIMRRRGRFLLFLFSLFLSANLVCS